MGDIRVLDSETIDKIAAGEVVERPASVVKELVENAIDAGAGAVTVEAKDGGIEFLRVTDNGSGMKPSQVRTAFLRHATSKIENAGDLLQVSSLGFRGEALSSVAAVSRVEIITKTPEALTGVRYLLEGAVEKGFEEIGAPAGTTIMVRNLFFNTPVRRKFLKQPATEGGYITDLMEHLALSRPDISFKFILGGQVKFHTSGNGDLREVIYRIYGRDVAAQLVPIQAERDGVRVDGYLGKPVLVRSNRNFEIYFVNGRFIRSKLVAGGIEEGYREYLMQHKFPLCVLHFHMDTERVDVNVHPTKMDVRFSDGQSFFRFLSEEIRNTLKQREMIPEASLGEERKEKDPEEKSLTPEPFELVRTGQYRVMEEAKYQAKKPKMQDFMQNPVWNRVSHREETVDIPRSAGNASENARDLAASQEGRKPEKDDREAYGGGPAQEDIDLTGGRETPGSRETSGGWETSVNGMIGMLGDSDGKAAAENRVEKEDEVFFVDIPEESDSAGETDPLRRQKGQKEPPTEAQVEPRTEPPTEAQKEPQAQGAEQINFFEEKLLSVSNRSQYQILGQVFDTYWLVQFEDKLFIIDQHAAHEKVKYERLMKQYQEKEVLSQGLLPPVIVSLSGQEEAALNEYLDTFLGLGFEIEPFGGSEYALRSVPVDLYGCGEREMFLAVLDELSGAPLRNSLKVVEEKIASMSCKAAVKGNNALSVAEAEMLIDELLTLENPYNCPHGRPTIISMTKSELEKKFKRIV